LGHTIQVTFENEETRKKFIETNQVQFGSKNYGILEAKKLLTLPWVSES